MNTPFLEHGFDALCDNAMTRTMPWPEWRHVMMVSLSYRWRYKLVAKFFLAYLNYFFINKINRDFIDWQLNQSIVTAWKVSVFGIFLVAFSRIRTETHQNNSECGHFLRSEWKLLIKILRSSPPWFELKNLNLVVCQRLRKVLTRK